MARIVPTEEYFIRQKSILGELETGNQGKRIVIKQFEMERMKVSKEGRNYMLQTSLILGPSAPWSFTGALRMELNRVRIPIRHFSRIVV